MAVFSPDGETLAIGGQTIATNALLLSGNIGYVDLLNVSSGKMLRDFLVQDTEEVSCLAFSPDGKTLAVSGEKDKVELRKVSTGELLKRLDMGTVWSAESLKFSPDGNTLAIGVRNTGALELWNISNGGLFKTLKSDGYPVAIFVKPSEQ